MASFLQFFLPRDKKFFPLFEQASGNLLSVSAVLNEMINAKANGDPVGHIKEIERLEHAGDAITHEIFNELSSTFITPFDREDIHRLATAIDDIVDFIHGAAKRMELYKVVNYDASFSKLAELIHRAADEIHIAVSGLRNMKNTARIKEACVKINSFENHADDIFDMTIAALFEQEHNAIELIKKKEILAALETATDKCEDAANVLETILLKAN